MIRSRTYYPKLACAFPAGDPLAQLAARAVVLYGDLLIEWSGAGDLDGCNELNKSGDTYRRLYFIRASCVTLKSCINLVDHLRGNEKFKAWIKEDSVSGLNFDKANSEIKKRSKIIERIRNSTGAHMEREIGESIARFGPEDVAAVEWHSRDIMRPHLAEYIVIATFLQKSPKEGEGDELVRILEEINAATKAMISALTEFLAMYSKRYPLLGDER